MNTNLNNIISSMPLEEKIAQITAIFISELLDGNKVSLEKCKQKIPNGIGHICQFGSQTRLMPDELSQAIFDIQCFIRDNTKSKIPALFHEETITGPSVRGVTVTPQMLGLSTSWNPQLAYENASMSARSLTQLGSYHALSPMVDVITDARWGRGEEGYGEDSSIVARFGLNFVKGLQENGVAATGKHYAGYGVENQDPVFFMNETLFPFEVLVKEGKVRGIMPGYHNFHDVPCSASSEILDEYLRKHLKFDGCVVSDYWAVRNTHTVFKYTHSTEENAKVCLEAGIDVDLPTGDTFNTLLDSVKNGYVQQSEVDKAVYNVLKLKQSVNSLQFTQQKPNLNLNLDTVENRKQALKCAEQSIVLLKNDGILPLAKKKIALVGPNADSYYSLLGDYTWGALIEFFHSSPADRYNPLLVTLKDALQSKEYSDFTVAFERGCDWTQGKEKIANTVGGDIRGEKGKRVPLEKIPETNYENAIKIANESDVIIAAMGENRFLCGECVNRENVNLPGIQEQFVEDLCKTGKPVILIIFGGRPMAIAKISEKCAGVIYAFYPGEEGGKAVAEILTGKVNPLAKLTCTIPNTTDIVPVHYSNVEQCKQHPPVYPFGFGLSYTKYSYSNFKIENKIKSDSYFDVVFDVTNIGNVDGTEISQIYSEDITKDKLCNKKLLGYTRSEIKKGKTVTQRLRVPVELFAKYNYDKELILKPAKIKLAVGSSSADIFFTQDFMIDVDQCKLNERTEFFSKQI